MLPGQIQPWILVPAVPVLWILGVQFGYVLGVAFKPFEQFGRFAAIGFSNAAVDFGVLYLAIALTGNAVGLAYSLVKAVSFSVATVHSYFWNKSWAFDASGSRGGATEVARFVSVALASLVVNVVAASTVVALGPQGTDARAWAGIGAVVGSAAALVFSFVGFRIFVFRKNK
jgi:putative flippase GtrA